MPWLYAINQMINGQTEVSHEAFKGVCLAAGPIGSWALYLYSGTAAQLTAIAALATVYPLAAMTDNGVIKWAELNNTVTAAHRTKLNTWLTARGYPTIPVGWSYLQILNALVTRIKRANDGFDLNVTWVAD